MEHLALEIFDLDGKGGSKYAWLPEDASITITDTSEIFASGDVWSHSFTLNTHANAHIFGTAGEIHGSRLHEQINKRKARLWVEGLPLYLGYLKLDDEVDVDENGDVDVTFESGKHTFDDMIEGMNARDVPMLADHLIGVAVWRDRLPNVKVSYRVSVTDPIEGTPSSDELSFTINSSQQTDRLATRWLKYVVHSGTFKTSQNQDFVVNRTETINTDYPYDDNAPTAHPYCNIDIGYQKKDDDGNAVRGYTIHEAEYPNTAPCFYAMYWFRALMKHLGIYIEENQMQNVEDLRRLFLMNTLCAYDEPETAPSAASGNTKNLKLTGSFFPTDNTPSHKTVGYTYDLAESKGVVIDSNQKDFHDKNVASFEITKVETVGEESIFGHPAYATSDCFPNVDAMEIINALQDAFGVRLLFSNDFNRVRVVLLRDIFRSQEVAELKCEITEDTKTENSVRGFMMSYSSDDTQFKLPIFDKVLDKEHDTDTTGNNYTLTPDEYSDIIKAASAFNKHLYYTANNGNAYVYKVDDEAKRFKDLFPSFFEAAGFMDAVDGKCSGEEGTFKSIKLAFTPLIVNDANMEKERAGSTEQTFIAFVGEEMKSQTLPFTASGDIYFKKSLSNIHIVNKHNDRSDVHWYVNLDIDGYIFETYSLYNLKDNFEQNDDGVAPIETHDWGLTLGVMRGSGNDAYIKYDTDLIENEGNFWWEIVPGSKAIGHPDICDSYGREWYYSAGTGNETVVVETDMEAVTALQNMFSESTVPFYTQTDGYITDAELRNVTYQLNEPPYYRNEKWLYATAYSKTGKIQDGRSTRIEKDSNEGRKATLLDLCKKAYGGEAQQSNILIDHGIESRYGRFSLKLRAEKPNPNFDAAQEESGTNRRFLEITNENLRGRGLADQFYKEYSYWIRNARIIKRTVRMELAQLLTIDKTKRITVGDVTGFVKKMQYSVSNQTGLGEVAMEIMYI